MVGLGSPPTNELITNTKSKRNVPGLHRVLCHLVRKQESALMLMSDAELKNRPQTSGKLTAFSLHTPRYFPFSNLQPSSTASADSSV